MNLKNVFQSRDKIDITIIDSGLGGILFSESIKKIKLDLNVITKIDSLGFPYGNKEISWLIERLSVLVDESNTNLVLIACNTLSSVIYKENLKFNKRVVDVITPTIYFFRKKKYRKICILATTNTIKMNVYGNLLSDVYYLDATTLINNIEKGIDYQEKLLLILSFMEKGTDYILLGCTHLVKIKKDLRKMTNFKIVSQDEIITSLIKKSFSKKKHL